MPAKVLSDNEVDQLVRQGRTPAQIADYYHDHHHVDVTPEAVEMNLRRRGVEVQWRMRHEDLIPWIIAEEHKDRYAPRMLRNLGRRRAGERLRASEAKKLDAWLSRLEREQVVVDYRRDEAEPWVYVPRRADDDEYVRRPRA
jgi:hypothetical protein